MIAAETLGLTCLWFGVLAAVLLSSPSWVPPARPEFEPVEPVFPEALKVKELSSSHVYVGNCCTAYQSAYYTPASISQVRSFYEAELGITFVSGVGFPVHPNFDDYGKYPSCMSAFFCRPDCDISDHTSQSVALVDANELLMKGGTVIIFQVHEETFWYKYEYIEVPAAATMSPLSVQ